MNQKGKHDDQTVDLSAAPPALNCVTSPFRAEDIYEAYPRKSARTDALKAIAKAIESSGHTIERLLAQTHAYASATARWSENDRRFIPHPATWFNRGSFDDDPATWARHNAGNNRVGTISSQDHANGF